MKLIILSFCLLKCFTALLIPCVTPLKWIKSSSEKAPQKNQERLHLHFLDGLRGLAALYVVLFHVIADGESELLADTFLLNFLRFGHEAVVTFIVLSGFVLALPVARSPKLAVSGGNRGFFKRRARRILPAYYPALLMVPLFILAVELSKSLTGEVTNWVRIRETFISPDMLAHLFLVHNLSPDWIDTINAPLWSLATEWWIYFVFALVLLPVWKRCGVYHAAIVSIILGLVPIVLRQFGYQTIVGAPHLLGAFGLGMVGAAIFYKARSNPDFAALRPALMIVAGLALAMFSWISIYAPSIRKSEWSTDLLIAVSCAIFVILLALQAANNTQTSDSKPIVRRFLESRPLIFLELFSYSLYLTHMALWPILIMIFNLAPVKQAINFSLNPMPVRILVLIPLLLIFAYVFFFAVRKAISTPSQISSFNLKPLQVNINMWSKVCVRFWML